MVRWPLIQLTWKVKFPRGTYCSASVFYGPDKNLPCIACLFTLLFCCLSASALCCMHPPLQVSFSMFFFPSVYSTPVALSPPSLFATALWQPCKGRVISYHRLSVGGKKRLELQCCQPSSCLTEPVWPLGLCPCCALTQACKENTQGSGWCHLWLKFCS